MAKRGMFFRPPPSLSAVLQERALNRPSSSLGVDLADSQALGRRGFLKIATAGLAAFGTAAAEADPLVFSPDDANAVAPTPAYTQAATLQLGEIPADFWLRPRELWLRRHGTNQEIRVVYWRDGQLLSDGYWQACAMLRDTHDNVMTTMDPTVLDILRGIGGYYAAWQYRQPIVLTSGFRTLRTNTAIKGEGAAKNSMHLYGKAADLYIPGISARDVGILGMHLQQGGVGFYPSKGFTHLDTGRLRAWRG